MNRLVVLVFAILAFATSLPSQRLIVGISVSEIESELSTPGLNNAMHILEDLGYGILHYDQSYVIAVTPAKPGAEFNGAIVLADYPPERNLYLLSRDFSERKPNTRSVKVLLEAETFYLIQSELSEELLRNEFDSPMLRLNTQPMRLTGNNSLRNYAASTRTDLEQLISFVSSDSLIARVQNLQNFQTRYALAANRLTVAQWIRQQFLNYGLTDAHLETFTYSTTQQYNVIATIPGTLHPDEYIIVGGHYDSRSSDTDPLVTAPGADDNASGTAATMEIARVIMQSGYQPPVSIRFVAYGCEEFGLIGSYADALTTFNAGLDIRLMINHDMLANNAGDTGWQVRLMPYDGSLDYNAYATQITDQYTALTPYNGSMNSSSSDSYPYWLRGHPVIYFFESVISPNYHTSTDVVANMNPGYFTEVVKASLACTAFFADLAEIPEPELSFEDNFDYAVGTNLTANGWTAFSTAGVNPIKVVAPGLSFADYPSVSAYATAISGSGEDVRKGFQPIASDAVYASFLVNVSSVNTIGDFFLHLSSNPINSAYYRGRIFVKTNSSGNLAFGLSNNGALATAVFTGFNYTLNSTHLLVLKYEFVPGTNNDLVRLFINPDIEVEEPGATLTATDAITTEPVSIGTIELRQGTAPNAPYATIDGIRISKTWMAVLGIQEETLPVELSSFSAIASAENYIALNWVTQSETNLRGYYLHRNEAGNQLNAQLVSPLIPATNTTQQHSYVFSDTELYESGTFYYWLESVELDGNSQFYGPVSAVFDPTYTIPPVVPIDTELNPVYPNPFNPYAYISYSVGNRTSYTDVNISIYNTRGQLIRSFALDNREPGHHHFAWDGTDSAGRECSSGVYYIRMSADNEIYQRKAILLK